MKPAFLVTVLGLSALALSSKTARSFLLKGPVGSPTHSFGTCSFSCENYFNTQLIQAERQRLRGYLARANQITEKAVSDLYTCLQVCVDSGYSKPPFLAVPDPSRPGQYTLVRFSLGAYHQQIVDRYLPRNK